VVGGLILAHFWWGAVFLINVPIMLLLLALGPYLLREFRDPNAGRIDPLSAAQSMAAVLAIIYGIKRVAESGWAPLPLFAIGAGVLVGAYFVQRQLALAEPLIDVGLFRVRGFTAALATNIVALFVTFGTFLFIAQYLQLVLGMGPLEAGLWTAPSGVIFALGSVAAPFLVRRFQPSLVIAAGFLVSAVGFLLLTQLSAAEGPWLLFAGMMILCLGVAPTGAITTDIVMAEAPPERAGAASGISETSFEFGGALGIAVLGSLVTAIYRSAMSAAELTGVPAPAVEAARDTLGGAVEAAQQLGGPAGSMLLGTARAAFVTAFEIASLVSAAGAVAAAVFAWVVLGKRR
jgi:DHA2 family multidrug resistance protein-like MFS transporter